MISELFSFFAFTILRLADSSDSPSSSFLFLLSRRLLRLFLFHLLRRLLRLFWFTFIFVLVPSIATIVASVLVPSVAAVVASILVPLVSSGSEFRITLGLFFRLHIFLEAFKVLLARFLNSVESPGNLLVGIFLARFGGMESLFVALSNT